MQKPNKRLSGQTCIVTGANSGLIPYKRIGKPEDIGNTAVWLASDESEYVNGTTIYVDGGMTCFPDFTTNG